MLQLSQSILNKPIISLRTGAVIGQATNTLINPNNLKIEGLYCTDRFNGNSMILLQQDIREFSAIKGYMVNDQDALSDIPDLIRLKDVIDLNFQLLGKTVVTTSKKHIGKINDYAVDIQSMYIQKIYASQSLLKNFTGGSLSIDRAQINEVTDKRVIINDLLKDSRIPAAAVV